ncbi:MAG: TRAP transporter permease, partial [Lachnospiraceae bacterium]|nr:TRAP transporter permease [Lachnospiraceae bacterium]
YIFCFNPEMLLIDTNVLSVISIYVTAFFGIVGVASALEGYFVTDMGVIDRILFTAGGLMMIFPGTVTDAFGLGLIAVAIAMQFARKKKTVSV